MPFDWNPQKAAHNLRKQGVSFELAQEVFSDPFCVTIEERVVNGELRYWTIGRLEKLMILVVVHTISETAEGDEVIRIISARRATSRERRLYEEVEY